MSEESLQDCLLFHSRKRHAPALTAEANEDEPEVLIYPPQANKVAKLSNGSESRAALESSDGSFDALNVAPSISCNSSKIMSCYSPLA